MKINSLLSGYSDPASLAKLLESSGTTGNKPVDQATGASGTSQSTSDQVRSIVSRYDLNSMTPQQLSEMLQSLHEVGALTDQQLQELSQIRTDLDRQGVQPDESIDLMDYCSQRLDQLQKVMEDDDTEATAFAENTASLQSVSRWLVWLQKVALMQSAPDATTVNAVV